MRKKSLFLGLVTASLSLFTLTSCVQSKKPATTTDTTTTPTVTDVTATTGVTPTTTDTTPVTTTPAVVPTTVVPTSINTGITPTATVVPTTPTSTTVPTTTIAEDLYTITFDVNGGEALEDNTKTVKLGSTYNLPTPMRSNYEFAGWYNGDTLVNISGKWNIESNITLTAKWVFISTVTFDADGGELNISSLTIKNGSTYSLPEPTRTNYEFAGWYNGNVLVKSEGTWSIESNVELKARWIFISTVTLDVNGGNSLSTTVFEIKRGEEFKLPTPTREKYEFAGWYNGDELFASSGAWNIDEDVTLTAKWIFISTVTLDVNGGDYTIPTVIDYKVGYNYNLPEPTKTNYKFLGWYNGDTLVPSSGTWSIDEDVTLTAKWKFVSEITLDVNGGDELEDDVIYILLDDYYELPEPTRTGYEFNGWYWNDDEYIGRTGGWTIEENVTLVAHWSRKSLNLTIDSNGGYGVNNETISLYYGEEYTLKKPVKPRYKFLGWYNGDQLLGNNITITDNINAVAKWEYNADYYMITYHIDDGASLMYGNSVTSQATTYYAEAVIGQYSTVFESIKSGYQFAGWYTSNDEYYSDYPYGQGSFVWNTREDLVLYSKYVQEGLTFTLINNTYSVKYDEKYAATTVTIPYTYRGKNVTIIEEGAFVLNSTVETINLPSTIKTIEAEAFKECTNLKNITIPSNVTSIGSYAFFYCESLTSLSIPSGVKDIKTYTFAGCKALESLILPEVLSSFSFDAIYKCTSLMGWSYNGGLYLGGNSNRYMILFAPYSTESEELIIHPDCIWIKPGVFENHQKINTVIVASREADIPDYAFKNCTALTTVTIKTSSLYSIGKSAFEGCTKLSKVNFDTNTCTSIGSSAFLSCSSLKSITITNQVSYIGMWAFNGSGITSATFDDRDGWYTTLSVYGDPFEYLESSKLKSTSTAAKYLESDYAGRYWYKSESEED